MKSEGRWSSLGLLSSVVVVSLLVVTGCSSSGSRSAAGASESGFPAVSVSGSAQPSASGSAAGVGGAVPPVPRVSTVGEGHELTVVLTPGSSVPVTEYLLTVLPRDMTPPPGAPFQECRAQAPGVVQTRCALYAKRGDWDVYVAAANDVGSSDWYGPMTFAATSGPCTDEVAAAGACDLRDTGPGGGVIFYDAGTPQAWGQYLEAAPKGWSGGSQQGPFLDPSYKWCSTDQPGYNKLATGTAVGTGGGNTQLIVANCGSDSAAGAAQSYRGGGKTDWFLPSKDELMTLYNIARSEAGMCEDIDVECIYWSSSEDDSGEISGTDATAMAFSSASTVIVDKAETRAVHPVRAF